MQTPVIFAVVFLALGLSSCKPWNVVLRNWDLAFSARSTDGKYVERLGASKDFSEIANAKLVAVRHSGDSKVTEFDVVETHYLHRTNTVVYTGRITFRCQGDEAFCSPIQMNPISGTRPRNVFWRWPSRMDIDPRVDGPL